MGVVYSIIMALIISLGTFVTKLQKGEPFDAAKLLRTVIIGAVLGGAAWYGGAVITPENWEAYLLANAGAIAVADQAVKFISNLIWKPKAV